MNGGRFAIYALAAYRLTRLVTLDRITERWRVAARRLGGLSAYLVDCAWCVSVYVALGLWALVTYQPKVGWPAATILAASTVCGLIGSRDA